MADVPFNLFYIILMTGFSQLKIGGGKLSTNIHCSWFHSMLEVVNLCLRLSVCVRGCHCVREVDHVMMRAYSFGHKPAC